MPAMTRSMIVARSNSAKTPSICTIIRPGAEVVSNGSEAERKPTSAASSCSSSCVSPRAERADVAGEHKCQQTNSHRHQAIAVQRHRIAEMVAADVWRAVEERLKP